VLRWNRGDIVTVRPTDWSRFVPNNRAQLRDPSRKVGGPYTHYRSASILPVATTWGRFVRRTIGGHLQVTPLMVRSWQRAAG